MRCGWMRHTSSGARNATPKPHAVMEAHPINLAKTRST